MTETEGVINFYTESINFVLREKTLLRVWLDKCAKSQKRKIGSLTYVFCNDRFLRKMNKQFLNHDYNTDIITFPQSLPDSKLISGEMYISIERVRDYAKSHSISFKVELHRVMVHGLLHLCGHDDHSEKDQQKMRALEDRCLSKR